MLKLKTLPLIFAVLALAAAVAGCGTSTAPGIVLAPSNGATADSATTAASASATATTSTSSAPATPLPSALKTEPNVAPPTGPAPKTLVVKDLIKGTGPAVTSTNQTLTVQYVGKVYKSGKVFDASWSHPGAQPTALPLSGVIPGWQKGLIGMKVGGRRELIIPPGEGYGATAQAKIPANSTLVFVIDLHSISG
jgi:FKBP-type peptidyl-prolyl cis-trans isomerase